jgi:carboxypeptidase PM20D1
MPNDPKAAALKELHRIWVDILMALLGLIQGLIFNDLANKFSKYITYPGDMNWLAIAHLCFCFAMLIRVIQTYVTAALYYKKFLHISEILIMTAIGTLQHLLADSVRDPSPSGPAIDFKAFYWSTLFICILGAIGYSLTVVALVRQYFRLSTKEPQNPTDFWCSLKLQRINFAGLLAIGILSGIVLRLQNPEQKPLSLELIALGCAAILAANTIHSSRESFLRGKYNGSTRLPEQLVAHEFLPAARLLIRNFGYVLSVFLPRLKGPRRRAEIHSRILALAMASNDGNHLLGWRTFRGLRDVDRLAAVAVVSWPGASTSNFRRTVLAFVFAIAVRSPLQLFSCLLEAYKLRDVLRPPGCASPDMAILYIATVDPLRRRGYARRLLGRLWEEAHKRRLSGIVAAVREQNNPALKLFETSLYFPSFGEQVEPGGLIYLRQQVTHVSSGPRLVDLVKPRRHVTRYIAIGVLGLLVCVVLMRGVFAKSQQQPRASSERFASTVPLADTLAEVVRLRTISYQDHRTDSGPAFQQMLLTLQGRFPAPFRQMVRQDVPEGGLLLTLPGKDSDLAPILLYAHFDVVPANSDEWKYDPFSGFSEGGFLYGRGAIDDKLSVVAILGSLQTLLARGWHPERTVYVAFGNDEENDGLGARAIAAFLERRGVRLEMILDEGGAIVDGKIPGIANPVAAVGIAEKGYLDIKICGTGEQGHSSSPPDATSIAIVSQAVNRVTNRPPPRRLNSLVEQSLTYGAAEMSFPFRLVATNLWLTGPLVQQIMEADPVRRSLLGTTQAATLFNAGTKSNVLPVEACATVNYRLFPGISADDMVRRVGEIVHDSRIHIDAKGYTPAPEPSDLSSAPGQILARAIRTEFHDSVVIPVVSPGTTDSRHFATIAGQIFRFSPVHLSNAELAGIHGVNERVRVSDVDKAYQFYCTLLDTMNK